MTKLLDNPTTQDEAYRTAQRLFRSDSKWNLGRQRRSVSPSAASRGSDSFSDIRRARRKTRPWETRSIGKSVIDCAKQSGCHIVIVARDSDYGMTFGGRPVINDWLLQEFRERVSKKRKLVLTDRLSTALTIAQITVTKQEVESEARFLQERPVGGTTGVGGVAISGLSRWEEAVRREFVRRLQELAPKTTITALDPFVPPAEEEPEEPKGE